MAGGPRVHGGVLLCLAGLGACGEVRQSQTIQLPADGVRAVTLSTERGDLAYSGNGVEETFLVEAVQWGRAASDARAAARVEGTDFGATLGDGALTVWGTSGGRRAGVDLLTTGPRFVDVEAWAPDGTVALFAVDGFHYLTASRVVGEEVHGDVDAYASYGGIDLEVWPRPGSVVRLESVHGDLVVALPVGLPYDLDLAGDPAYGYELADLGFDALTLGPGYAFAAAGDGSIRVELLATGGVVRVVPADLPTAP